MLKRVKLNEQNFLLVDFEEQVYLHVSTFRRKAYVKELTRFSLEQTLSDYLT